MRCNHYHLLYHGHSALAVERPGIPFPVPFTYIQHRQTPRHYPPTLPGNPSRRPTASRTGTACQSQIHSGGTISSLSTNTQAFTPSNGQEGPPTYTHGTNAFMGPPSTRALQPSLQNPFPQNTYNGDTHYQCPQPSQQTTNTCNGDAQYQCPHSHSLHQTLITHY